MWGKKQGFKKKQQSRINKQDTSTAAIMMRNAQQADPAFLAAVRDTNLETLIASGNPQLLHALQELDQLR
jgi:hypothetical protein